MFRKSTNFLFTSVPTHALNAGPDTHHRWQFAYVELARKPQVSTNYCFEGIVRRVVDSEPPEANFEGRDQIVIIGNAKYRHNDVLAKGTRIRWELSDKRRRLDVQKRCLYRALNSTDTKQKTVIIKLCDGPALRSVKRITGSRRVANEDTRHNKRKAAKEQERQPRLTNFIRKTRLVRR